MSDKWVVNASPLILLAKVGQLGLLTQLAPTLVVPASVANEIHQGPAADPARDWLAGSGASLIQLDVPPAPSILAWDLGAGESAVLSRNDAVGWRATLRRGQLPHGRDEARPSKIGTPDGVR